MNEIVRLTDVALAANEEAGPTSVMKPGMEAGVAMTIDRDARRLRGGMRCVGVGTGLGHEIETLVRLNVVDRGHRLATAGRARNRTEQEAPAHIATGFRMRVLTFRVGMGTTCPTSR